MKENKKGMISMRCDEKMVNDFKSIANKLKLSQRETLIYLMEFYNNHKPIWKSVKEQLPPVEETVLVYVTNGYGEPYMDFGYLEFYESERKWVFRDLEYNDISSIVEQWMTIPQKLFEEDE